MNIRHSITVLVLTACTAIPPAACAPAKSSPFANSGESALRRIRAASDGINARGVAPGYRFGIVALEGMRRSR